jgi:non-specific serine/threonine protein kinase/serine/threonine-protein kinase
MSNLAMLYRDQGKYAQAEPLSIKVIEVQRRTLGEEHPDTLLSMNSLGVLYRDQRKFAQAEPLSTKVLELQRRLLGEEHPETLNAMGQLGFHCEIGGHEVW